MTSTSPRLRPLLMAGAAWLASALVFFRTVWSSGFDHLQGNDGDTRLLAYLCEHWFQVLHGHASWLNPNFFYPVRGLLGWSDSCFLLEFLYAPLRELGAGPVLAFQLTVIALSAVGFVGFFYVARICFSTPDGIAVAGAAMFTFANNLYLHIGNSQLAGVYLLPLVVLLGRAAVTRAGGHPARALGLATVDGVLVGLIFYTTYYIAIFAALAAAIAAFWLLALRGGAVIRHAQAWRANGYPRLVGGGAIGFLAGMTPVVVTYLPARSAVGGASYNAVMVYSISWRSLFDVGFGNLVWGGVLKGLDRTGQSVPNADYALTPIFLIVLIVAGVWLGWRLRTGRASPGWEPWAGFVLVLTAVTLMLLPVRIAGRPPWLLLWLLPGFDAIRAIGRIQILANAVGCLALMAAATEIRLVGGGRPMAGRRFRFAVGALLSLMVVEQVNTAPIAAIDRQAQDRFLASIPAAPASCRYFYVSDSLNPDLAFYESQIDAMFVAQKDGLPTLNGYTGYNPRGWNLEEIGAPGYGDAVEQWEQAHNTGPGACRLDIGTMKWAPG